jgi:hypothetical protein
MFKKLVFLRKNNSFVPVLMYKNPNLLERSIQQTDPSPPQNSVQPSSDSAQQLDEGSANIMNMPDGSVTIIFSVPPDIFERIADDFCLTDIYGANILLMERK